MKNHHTIKDVADMLHMSTDAIRLYEKEGLISPYHDPDNGYRYYNTQDIQRLMGISFYRKMNASLKDIKSYFGVSTLEGLSSICDDIIDNNRKQIEELLLLEKRISFMRDHMQELNQGLGKCQIKTLGNFYTPLFKREEDNDYQSMWEAGDQPYFSYGNECYVVSIDKEKTTQVHVHAHMYAIREAMFEVAPILENRQEVPRHEAEDCIYRVVCYEDLKPDVSELETMIAYAKEHNFKPADYFYCFYIISTGGSNEKRHYFELYLPFSK